MRSKPRPYPMVKLNRNCHDFGRYDQTKNVIEFGCRCDDEEDAINTLIHEEQHWATWMYLTPKEMMTDKMPSSSKDFEKYACWMPEYISITVEHLVNERSDT